MSSLPLILEAAGLRVSFHACGDRIAHTVGLTLANRVVPLMASVEGTEDEDWPPSPPLATIERPMTHGAPRAMLIGMAGRSHWSVSVALEEASRRLEFDVACRVASPPARLGCAYRTMLVPSEQPECAELAVDGERIHFTPLSPNAAVRITPDGLAVAVEPPEGPFPVTVRWKFEICWLP
jgi:hypothetical protein